jgi:hypothetical protein
MACFVRNAVCAALRAHYMALRPEAYQAYVDAWPVATAKMVRAAPPKDCLLLKQLHSLSVDDKVNNCDK